MLNRHNLNIAALCNKDDSRFTLSALYVTPEATIETDGHQMMMVTRPNLDPQQFPEIPGAVAVATHEAFLLGAEEAVKAGKSLPKKTTIPILQNAAVTTVPSGEEDGTRYGLVTTDLSTHQVFRQYSDKDRKFPDYKRVIWPPASAEHRICIDASLLRRVLAQFESFQSNQRGAPVQFFFRENGAIRLDAEGGDGQHMTALVMPMMVKPGEWFGIPFCTECGQDRFKHGDKLEPCCTPEPVDNEVAPEPQASPIQLVEPVAIKPTPPPKAPPKVKIQASPVVVSKPTPSPTTDRSAAAKKAWETIRAKRAAAAANKAA